MEVIKTKITSAGKGFERINRTWAKGKPVKTMNPTLPQM